MNVSVVCHFQYYMRSCCMSLPVLYAFVLYVTSSIICVRVVCHFQFYMRSCCIIIIIIKKDWQCKAGRGRLTPYQSEDPSPTLPTYRGKEEKNGKSTLSHVLEGRG